MRIWVLGDRPTEIIQLRSRGEYIEYNRTLGTCGIISKILTFLLLESYKEREGKWNRKKKKKTILEKILAKISEKQIDRFKKRIKPKQDKCKENYVQTYHDQTS